MEYLVSRFGQDVIAVEDEDRPADPAAAVTVLDRERIIDRPLRAGIADRTAEEFRLGEVRSRVRAIIELPRAVLSLIEDDVRDLAGQSRDPEARGIFDFDPHDVRSRRPLELVHGARLVVDPLAVDEDIFGCLAKSANARVHGAARESWNLDQHVVRRFGRETGEVRERVNAFLRRDCDCMRRGRDGRVAGSCRLGEGRSRQNQRRTGKEPRTSGHAHRQLPCYARPNACYICSVLHL